MKILTEHIDELHRLSEVLLEREILDSEEIDKVIRGEELPPVEKNGTNGNGAANCVTTTTESETTVSGK